MNTLENQSVTKSNPELLIKVVLILISTIAVVLICTLLHLSYIRGGDKILNYASGILLAITLVAWTMWPTKASK